MPRRSVTDPHLNHLALVLEVVPDVLPGHAKELIAKHHPVDNDQVVERVLEELFDDPAYPKVEKGAGWKLKTQGEASTGLRQKQPGANYRTLVLNQFRRVLVSHKAIMTRVRVRKGKERCEEEECGCCFSLAPFRNMIQCPDAHLFCTECIVAYASNLLGEHNFKITCMDQSECGLPFSDSELERFLPPKLLSLYTRVKQTKEVDMAGLDGLEECPHCEFKAVIDDPGVKVFRCQNEECEAVTCRGCKRPDHRPKSCAEADKDKRIDARHVVEEAMTNALLRSCPKCKKTFVKVAGCNQMTCPSCGTHSCYLCRKAIHRGHSHFSAKGCSLFDENVKERHRREVEEAQRRAIAEYREEHPEMDEDALRVPPVRGFCHRWLEAAKTQAPGVALPLVPWMVGFILYFVVWSVFGALHS